MNFITYTTDEGYKSQARNVDMSKWPGPDAFDKFIEKANQHKNGIEYDVRVDGIPEPLYLVN